MNGSKMFAISIRCPVGLRDIAKKSTAILPRGPQSSSRCSICWGRRKGVSVEALLGLPQLGGSFRYTAVVGDSSPRQFETQLAHYVKAGFSDFKIKLSGDRTRDLAKVNALAALGIAPQAVRADANNLWADAAAAIGDLKALGFPFSAVEEPLRAGDYAGMRQIASALDTKIILDESLLRQDQLALIGEAADCYIVNLRVSKMGGLLRSLELVRELRRPRRAHSRRSACRRNQHADACRVDGRQ